MRKTIKLPKKEEILYEYVKRAIVSGKYGVVFNVPDVAEKTNKACSVWASLSIYYAVFNRLYRDGQLRVFPLGHGMFAYASEEYAAIYLTRKAKKS